MSSILRVDCNVNAYLVLSTRKYSSLIEVKQLSWIIHVNIGTMFTSIPITSIREPRSGNLDPGTSIREPCSWNLDPGSLIREPRSGNLDPGTAHPHPHAHSRGALSTTLCGALRGALCGALSTALSTALCRGIHRFDPWFQSAVWRARGHRAHWAQPTVARADDVRRGKRRRRHCASGYDFRTFAWSVDARCCVTTVRYRVRTALQQPDAAFGRRGSELCAGEIPASK